MTSTALSISRNLGFASSIKASPASPKQRSDHSSQMSRCLPSILHAPIQTAAACFRRAVIAPH